MTPQPPPDAPQLPPNHYYAGLVEDQPGDAVHGKVWFHGSPSWEGGTWIKKKAHGFHLALPVKSSPAVPVKAGEVTCNPPLDCDRGALVAYIKSMKDGERVTVLGRCCEEGMQGTVVIKDNGVCIKLDPYPSGGQMTVSFLGGARRLTDVFPNVPDAQNPPVTDSQRDTPMLARYADTKFTPLTTGDDDWWRDYLRSELENAHQFYLKELATAKQDSERLEWLLAYARKSGEELGEGWEEHFYTTRAEIDAAMREGEG